jgi:hypothetical protein
MLQEARQLLPACERVEDSLSRRGVWQYSILHFQEQTEGSNQRQSSSVNPTSAALGLKEILSADSGR